MKTSTQTTATPAVHSVQPLPAELPGEPIRAELELQEIQKAARWKWEGWDWRKYQPAIIRGNYHISKLEASHARLVAALEKITEISESGVVIRHETDKPTWYSGNETAKIARAALAAAKAQP